MGCNSAGQGTRAIFTLRLQRVQFHISGTEPSHCDQYWHGVHLSILAISIDMMYMIKMCSRWKSKNWCEEYMLMKFQKLTPPSITCIIASIMQNYMSECSTNNNLCDHMYNLLSFLISFSSYSYFILWFPPIMVSTISSNVNMVNKCVLSDGFGPILPIETQEINPSSPTKTH